MIGWAWLTLIILVPLVDGLLEPYFIKTIKKSIWDKDIPPAFDKKKIVFISDIHHGIYFYRARLRRLVKRINRLKPDIIILGGDYVHKHKVFISSCFEELRDLKARLGIFAVLGNHDHWVDAELIRKYLKRCGFILLENEGYWLTLVDQKIKIGGTRDLWWDDPDIRPIIKDVSENDFVILVSHNPDLAEEIKNKKIDLVLAGHTHGGQVTFFGLWAPIVPSRYGQRYRSGVVKTPYTKVIISKGVGTISPPFRFFCRPDFYLLTLRKRK